MRLWRKEVYGVHVGVELPLFLDPLDICDMLPSCTAISVCHVLAIFSLRMSSSLTTLSIIFLAVSSITSTFHCIRSAKSQRSSSRHTSPRVIDLIASKITCKSVCQYLNSSESWYSLSRCSWIADTILASLPSCSQGFVRYAVAMYRRADQKGGKIRKNVVELAWVYGSWE